MPSVRDVAHAERQRVIAAVPNAGAARDAILELARLDAVAVACVAADPSVSWWRRRPSALSLEGRVPDALAATLWERIEDDGDVTEVRVALLSVLVPWCVAAGSPAATVLADRALAWLRARS